ncbi:MAG: outer membrane lipoprotein carrier protein LolA, partial [Armatimonadetes bacterium]|nr:outer membrane lipoprotein carrier protein LolA [Armatimonadota bacterium]
MESAPILRRTSSVPTAGSCGPVLGFVRRTCGRQFTRRWRGCLGPNEERPMGKPGVRSGPLLLAVPLLLTAPAMVRADEQADRVVQRAREAITRLRSFQAEFEYTSGTQNYQGSVALLRPNLARVELKDGPIGSVVSDGKVLYQYMPRLNQITTMEIKPDGDGVRIPLATHLTGFFDPKQLLPTPEGSTVAVRREAVGGTEFDVLEVTYR